MPPWLEALFYVAATLGCGTFLTWLMFRLESLSGSVQSVATSLHQVTSSVVRLREHEHNQNNTLHALTLINDQHADDLGAIRRSLGIPRDA